MFHFPLEFELWLVHGTATPRRIPVEPQRSVYWHTFFNSERKGIDKERMRELELSSH